MLSPFHLAAPIFEVTGEYALSPKLGVAGILGYGSITDTGVGNTKVKIPVLEIGTQLNYYLLGTFKHGMQAGGELLWLKFDPPEEQGITASANGFAIGPFLGYKWAPSGLTIVIQGGYQLLFAQSKEMDSNGQELEGSVDGGIVLLNMNAGWSF